MDESGLTSDETLVEGDVQEPEQESLPEQGSESEYVDPAEALARQRGWRPESEYKGKPGTWIDYSDYNHRFDFRQRKLSEERAKSERISQLEAEVQRLSKGYQAQDEARQQITEAQLLDQIATASENGDHRQVASLYRDLARMEAQKVVPQRQTQQADPNVQLNAQAARELDSFFSANPVFKTDSDLEQQLMEQTIWVAEMGNKTGRPLMGQELLYEAARRVQRDNPDKFSRRRGPAMAETNGRPLPRANGQRSWNDLTDEARSAFEDTIRNSDAHRRMKLTDAQADILKYADDSHFRTARR